MAKLGPEDAIVNEFTREWVYIARSAQDTVKDLLELEGYSQGRLVALG
jgi:hypothetical protein